MEREGTIEDSNISDLTKSLGADGPNATSKAEGALVERPSDAEPILDSKHTANSTNLSWADQSDDPDEKGDVTTTSATAQENAPTDTIPKKHVNSDHLTKQLQKLALERQKVSSRFLRWRDSNNGSSVHGPFYHSCFSDNGIRTCLFCLISFWNC